MIPKNPKIRIKFNRKLLKKINKIVKNLIIIFFISSISITIIYRRLNPPITNFMSYRFIEQIIWPNKIIFNKNRLKIEKIPSNIIYWVIWWEDQKFLKHFWFDLQAIQKAYEYNTQMNQTILWWSTISQQTAKNLFLWPSRSYIRKWLEIYFTLLIETLRSKERILEVYLNIIEFWNWIYWIQSASKYYFKKPVDKLTNSQIAFLIAILPNPRYYQNNKNSLYLNNRKNIIINSLYKMKWNKDNKIFIKEIKK
jgi:monofunctional biosynthetic peptidoglycan transglycosylase